MFQDRMHPHHLVYNTYMHDAVQFSIDNGV